jgi:hypothetical protein
MLPVGKSIQGDYKEGVPHGREAERHTRALPLYFMLKLIFGTSLARSADKSSTLQSSSDNPAPGAQGFASFAARRRNGSPAATDFHQARLRRLHLADHPASYARPTVGCR